MTRLGNVIRQFPERMDWQDEIEVAPEDGELRTEASADFEGLEPTATNVDNLVDACLAIPRHWMGTIAEVALGGRTAEETLAARDAAESSGEPDGDAPR